ncbi:MAG: fibronectin type III domain-containing protein [Chthoniobacterales bacterium]
MLKQNGFFPRVALGFVQLTDPNLVSFATNVVTLTTGNASYPTPTPTLAAVTTASSKLSDLAVTALNRDRIAIATRNAAREELLTLMRTLAAYVTCHCNEDVLTLITSGFDAVRAAGPIGVLSAPENPRLSYTGMSGDLLFRIKSNSNARNYSIETAEQAEGPWKSFGLSTTASVTINELTPGKTYWVRACANGTAGSSDWSVPTSMMAV